MDREAIDRIVQFAEHRPLHTHVPTVLVPKDMEIASLEQFSEAPSKQRVRFCTERLSDFLAYVKADAGSETSVFVNPDGTGAAAIIDFGSHDQPRWKAHQAVLAMNKTPEFAALEGACHKAMSQRDLIEFLEDWNSAVNVVDKEGEDLPLGVAIQTLRSIDIKASVQKGHEEQDFRTSVSSLEEIEAKAAKGSLPHAIIMTNEVYPELDPVSVAARMSLLTGGEKPMFRLRMVGYQSLMHAKAREVEERIRGGLESVRVFVGQV